MTVGIHADDRPCSGFRGNPTCVAVKRPAGVLRLRRTQAQSVGVTAWQDPSGAGLHSSTDPEAPGIFAMSEPGRIRELLVEAGFGEPEIEEISFSWTFADKDAYWHFLTEVAGAIASALQTLPPEVQKQVHEAAEPFRSGDGYELPTVCLNVVAR